MKRISFIIPYATAAVIVSVMAGLIYVSVQHNYRSGANDPQIQIAKDIQARLQRGASVQKYMEDSVNLGRDLGVFTALYNRTAEPVKSSAFLDGKIPHLPRGVFDFVRVNGEERVTWQPRPGIRLATVIVRAGLPSIEFIVVGRSLQEVEIREHDLVISVFVSWVIAMAFIAIAAVAQGMTRVKQSLTI